MYKSIGAESKLLFKERILIPSPATAPVDSAAISVVNATEAPSLTAVKMNGKVAGAITLIKISLSVAPRTLAALINVSSTLINRDTHCKETCDCNNDNLCFSTNTCCDNDQRYICKWWDVTDELDPRFNNKTNRFIPGHHNCYWKCDYKSKYITQYN